MLLPWTDARTGNERLLRLAALLEADAADPDGVTYDQNDWCSFPYDAEPAMRCQTTACGMGIAAISGAFEADGLTWSRTPHLGLDHGDNWTIAFHYRGLRDLSGADAASRLFGLEHADSLKLFGAVDRDDGRRRRGKEAELNLAGMIRAFVEFREEAAR